MSTPNRAARKSAAINTTANKARTSAGKATTRPGKPIAGTGTGRVAKPTLGRTIGNKGREPVYEVPKPVKPRTAKK